MRSSTESGSPRSPVPDRAGRPWTDAAAVVGLVSAILLIAKYTRPLVGDAAWSLRFPESSYTPNAFADTGWRIVIWALVVIAAVAGWRLISIVGAWAGLLPEVVAASAKEPSGLAKSPEEISALTLVLITAVALSIPRSRRRAAILLGRRGVALAAAAGLAGVVGAAVEPLAWRPGHDDLAVVEIRYLNLLAGVTYAVVVGLLATSIARLAPVIRRRIVVLAVAVAAFLVGLRVMFGADRLGGFTGSVWDVESRAWLLLPLVASAVCLAAGVAVLRVREKPTRPDNA